MPCWGFRRAFFWFCYSCKRLRFTRHIKEFSCKQTRGGNVELNLSKKNCIQSVLCLKPLRFGGIWQMESVMLRNLASATHWWGWPA